MLLCCFDLPRETKEEKREATHFREKLITLGFTMKQYSIYERVVIKSETKDRLVDLLRREIPKTGSITIYVLPDHVNDEQITILGENAFKKTYREPRFIVV